MAGSPNEATRETRQCWRATRAKSPVAWLAGVRASVVAGKRVTTVERRERRKVAVRRTERRKRKPKRVPARANRRWHQPGANGMADTERLNGALGDEAKSRSLSTEHPPTGKPDAGEPPVRFGWGATEQSVLYPHRTKRGEKCGLGDFDDRAGGKCLFLTTAPAPFPPSAFRFAS